MTKNELEAFLEDLKQVYLKHKMMVRQFCDEPWVWVEDRMTVGEVEEEVENLRANSAPVG